jgi:hypothetical protein
VGGYWVTSETVEAVARVEVGDPLARPAAAGIELRITPSIWPFWRRVAGSTVEFSGSRLRNAAPHPTSSPDQISSVSGGRRKPGRGRMPPI